jgi:hypothetical protein
MTDAASSEATAPAMTADIGAAANPRVPATQAIQSFFRANFALLSAGVLLPNILSLATLISFVDFGLPPRTGCIFLYATLAACARLVPFGVSAVLFAAIVGFDVVSTLSLMFGLAPSELMAALGHAQRIHFFSSPLYATMIAVVTVSTVSTLYFLYRRQTLARGSINALAIAVLALAALDYYSNVSAHYRFGSLVGRNKPMASAIDVSGFRAAAGVNGRNVVVVVAESLGYLINPKLRELIAAPLNDPRIAKNYVVTSGHTVYYGATTAAEMRELCDTRVAYGEFVPKNGQSCLPDILHSRGYTSIAVHAYTGGMFERKEWYPKVGFDKEYFGEDLAPQTKRLCGSAFRGVCDADLAPVIAHESQLAETATHKPRFIYWLTLNTHIPVAPGDALTNLNCTANKDFGRPQVCRMAELWHDMFDTVAKLALDPAIGPAEILIVGDHAPPLWSKRGRAQFEPGQVAWYRLTPRAQTAEKTATP